MSIDNKDLIKNAFHYVNNHDIPAVPIEGKHPLIKWKIFQKRSPSLWEIASWKHMSKMTGIAGVTGTISDIAVLDIDPGADLSNHQIESPVSVQSGRGKHFYYKLEGEKIKSKTNILPNIDLKAEGGLVTLPPSLHVETGKTYKWIGEFKRNQLPVLPEWVKDLVKPKPTYKREVASQVSPNSGIKFKKRTWFPGQGSRIPAELVEVVKGGSFEEIFEDVEFYKDGYRRLKAPVSAS